MYQDFIARQIFLDFMDLYDEYDKFRSVFKQRASGRNITHVDDFCLWVDNISPRMAQDILNVQEPTWFNYRRIPGLVDSICSMYYSFDFPIIHGND